MAQTGYVKDFTYDRLNLRANTTVSLREKITVGVDLNVIRGTQHKASVDGATGLSILSGYYTGHLRLSLANIRKGKETPMSITGTTDRV